MSTTLNEWLQKTIAELEEERYATPGAVNEDAAKALAAMKIALGALEAEPIYQLVNDDWYDTDKDTYDVVVSSGARGRIVYTAPPSPTVPDKITSANAPEVFEIAAEAERLGLRGAYASYAVGWNACRAAMLQGAEPVTTAYKLPDGYVLVPVEPTEEMIAAAMCSNDVLFDKEDDTLFRVQHGEIWRAMLAAAPQQEA